MRATVRHVSHAIQLQCCHTATYLIKGGLERKGKGLERGAEKERKEKGKEESERHFALQLADRNETEQRTFLARHGGSQVWMISEVRKTWDIHTYIHLSRVARDASFPAGGAAFSMLEMQ